MKKYLFSTPLLFILLLLDHCSAAVYIPKDNITVNCGSSGSSPDDFTRSWTGDQNSKYSPIDDHSESSLSTTFTAPQRSDFDKVPYGTVRLSNSPFTYSFSVTGGPKFIRLYFYPFNYDSNFSRTDAFFTVTSSGYTLLRNFSAALTADNLNLTVFFREFCVNVEDNQKWLNLTFTPTTTQPNAYAFINGIEIVSMPVNLYYGDLNDLTAETNFHRVMFLGDNFRNPYNMTTADALETVYRINVGGSLISPSQDTGMYRTWDDGIVLDYLSEDSMSNSVLPYNGTMKINFDVVPNYTAPEAVYRTARSMGLNGTINVGYNLTWSFLVDTNFCYLVRLHFCEIVKEMTKVRDRNFRIFIATIMAENSADIILWTRSKGVPISRDYIVNMPDQEDKKVNLDIALHPREWGVDTGYADAILNGVEIFKISDIDRNLAGHNPGPVLVAPSTPLEPSSSKTRNSKVITIASIVGGVVSGIAVISLLAFLIFRRRKTKKDHACSDGTSFTTIKSRDSSLPAGLCRNFSLAEIKEATNDFNKDYVVGKGGFGDVYKGYIDGGSIPVAIKRLSHGSKQGAREFMTEIEMLSQLRHLHLVSLIGFCSDDGEMILVYDYMSRGTVTEHLYNTDKPPLPWKQRLEICIGAARGIHYLHTGTKNLIIHRDMKTTNILLDDKWIAKVADFGLSKIGPDNQAHVTTMVKGTFGYLDPEYYRRQQLTEKSDVYSFGVVLFEILCARPPVNRTAERNQISLATWALRCFKKGAIDKIVDPNLKGCISPDCLNKFVEVAVNCLHDEGSQRPSMADVVWSLEFALQLQETSEQETRPPVEGGVRDSAPLLWSSEGSSFTSSNHSNGMTSNTSFESEKVMTGMIFSDITNPQGR